MYQDKTHTLEEKINYTNLWMLTKLQIWFKDLPPPNKEILVMNCNKMQMLLDLLNIPNTPNKLENLSNKNLMIELLLLLKTLIFYLAPNLFLLWKTPLVKANFYSKVKNNMVSN